MGMDDKKLPNGKSAEQEDSPVVGDEALDSESTHGLGESALVSKHSDLGSLASSFKRVDELLNPSDKLAERYASLAPGTAFKGLEAVLGPTNKLAKQYESVVAGLGLKGLDRIFGPINKLTEQYAWLTTGASLKGLDSTFSPTSELADQYAWLTAGTSFKGLDSIVNPTSKLAEQYASLTAVVSGTGLDNIFGPANKLADQYAAFASGAKFNDLAALVRPPKEMASLFDSLKSLPSISEIERLFSAGDSTAKEMARSGSLAAMASRMTSLHSMIGIGASLATLGTAQATHHINWESLHSPSLLEAVDAATQIIEEDRLATGSLSALIGQLNAAINDGVANEAEPHEAATSMELLTAAKSRDVGQLSDAAKVYLVRLFWIISILCSYLALQNGVREELCFLQPKIVPSMTAGQVGKAIRAAACDVPLELLKDYRFVRGESVRLRAAPSYKAETVPIFLRDGDLLEVLSTEDRDWLHVRIVSQEGVEGWISRRYARQIVP